MKKTILSLLAMLATTSAFAGQITLSIGGSAELPSCEGTIRVTESGNQGGEQVNIVFAGVTQCSQFDIVKANGQYLNGYEDGAKRLQDKADGTRHGSFTIPKRLIAEGFNNIKVNLKSKTGAHSDTIKVLFNAYNTDPVGPINPPTSGGGW